VRVLHRVDSDFDEVLSQAKGRVILACPPDMPGASPEIMAATVATPLERHLGVIADVAGMSSESTAGITRITLQFNLNRSLDGAARDVQAAINAARADLPTSLRQNPTYHKVKERLRKRSGQ
jgi:multidrug efflux pump subunit AcrB